LKGVKPRAKIAKAFSDSAPSGTIWVEGLVVAASADRARS
jgi:hypothetical protein